jgi:hypothetical protein
LTPIFLFEKTSETKGTVTDTKWTYGIKGTFIQLVTYEYKVRDSLYFDKLKVGQRQGKQKIGDKLLIKYSVNKPKKNEVIGYFRASRNSDSTTKNHDSKGLDKEKNEN